MAWKLQNSYTAQTILKGEGLLQDACLSEIDLSYVHLSLRNLEGFNFRGSIFLLATAPRTNFSNADLRDTDFSRANLYKANMSGADLRGANLNRAYMFGVNLTGANLSEANLTNADLTGVQINK